MKNNNLLLFCIFCVFLVSPIFAFTPIHPVEVYESSDGEKIASLESISIYNNLEKMEKDSSYASKFTIVYPASESQLLNASLWLSFRFGIESVKTDLEVGSETNLILLGNSNNNILISELMGNVIFEEGSSLITFTEPENKKILIISGEKVEDVVKAAEILYYYQHNRDYLETDYLEIYEDDSTSMDLKYCDSTLGERVDVFTKQSFSEYNLEERCMDDQSLWEFFCLYPGVIWSVNYECPLGCSEGACINEGECGNGVCDGGENEENCFLDCGKSSCTKIGEKRAIAGEKRFCDLDSKLHLEKGRGDSCENDFECLSGECKSGECFDIYKEIKGREKNGNFFLKILCTLIHPFDDVERQQCING